MNLIRSNLKSFINYKEFFSKGDLGIKDITIHKNEIYLSYNKEVELNCYNISIIKADLNFDFLNFKEFFSYPECWKDNNASRNRSGGRIFIKDDKKILFSIGTFDEWRSAQNLNSFFGSIIEIDKNTKEFKLISKGHRNPQGLSFDEKQNKIISTDHGPKYGDEINLTDLNEKNITNFGWPISSYGDHYDDDLKRVKNLLDIAPLFKSHAKHGFKEPAKVYTKNVAPSGIISVSEKFSGYKNSYFISGLGFNQSDGAKALYVVNFDKNYNSIVNEATISIGERIRDLQYYERKNLIILFLESSASFAVLSLKNN